MILLVSVVSIILTSFPSIIHAQTIPEDIGAHDNLNDILKDLNLTLRDLFKIIDSPVGDVSEFRPS